MRGAGHLTAFGAMAYKTMALVPSVLVCGVPRSSFVELHLQSGVWFKVF
jgi:hypothetical protein